MAKMSPSSAYDLFNGRALAPVSVGPTNIYLHMLDGPTSAKDDKYEM